MGLLLQAHTRRCWFARYQLPFPSLGTSRFPSVEVFFSQLTPFLACAGKDTAETVALQVLGSPVFSEGIEACSLVSEAIEAIIAVFSYSLSQKYNIKLELESSLKPLSVALPHLFFFLWLGIGPSSHTAAEIMEEGVEACAIGKHGHYTVQVSGLGVCVILWATLGRSRRSSCEPEVGVL